MQPALRMQLECSHLSRLPAGEVCIKGVVGAMRGSASKGGATNAARRSSSLRATACARGGCTRGGCTRGGSANLGRMLASFHRGTKV